MKTLLELRDIEQKRVVEQPQTERPMFIAIDRTSVSIFNGWFLDASMNLIEVKGQEGKCVYLKDVEMARIQADFV